MALPLDDTIMENAQVEVWVGRCPGATLVEECEVLAHAGSGVVGVGQVAPSSSASPESRELELPAWDGHHSLASTCRGGSLEGTTARREARGSVPRARRLSWECWSSPTWSTRTSSRSAARSRSRPVSTAPAAVPRWRCRHRLLPVRGRLPRPMTVHVGVDVGTHSRGLTTWTALVPLAAMSQEDPRAIDFRGTDDQRYSTAPSGSCGERRRMGQPAPRCRADHAQPSGW